MTPTDLGKKDGLNYGYEYGYCNTALRFLQTRLALLEFRKASIQRQIDLLEQYLYGIDTRVVWCADFNEELSGIHPVLMAKGEHTPSWNLLLAPERAMPEKPGYLLQIDVMSPAQAAFNFAIHPGWQRWKPTYRLGTASNIDHGADTCTVTVDEGYSFYQHLPVQRDDIGRVFENVPIEYMTCDAAPFEDGDRVLVKFAGQAWASPVVIGFENNPRPCGYTLKIIQDYVGVIGFPTFDGTDDLSITVASFGNLYCWQSNQHEWIPTPHGYDWKPDGAEGIKYASYNSKTQEWLIYDLYGAEEEDGFWITVALSGSVNTQYPYRYRTSEWFRPEDKVKPGKYDVQVPIWRSEDVTDYTNTITYIRDRDGFIPEGVEYEEWDGTVIFCRDRSTHQWGLIDGVETDTCDGTLNSIWHGRRVAYDGAFLGLVSGETRYYSKEGSAYNLAMDTRTSITRRRHIISSIPWSYTESTTDFEVRNATISTPTWTETQYIYTGGGPSDRVVQLVRGGGMYTTPYRGPGGTPSSVQITGELISFSGAGKEIITESGIMDPTGEDGRIMEIRGEWEANGFPGGTISGTYQVYTWNPSWNDYSGPFFNVPWTHETAGHSPVGVFYLLDKNSKTGQWSVMSKFMHTASPLTT